MEIKDLLNRIIELKNHRIELLQLLEEQMGDAM